MKEVAKMLGLPENASEAEVAGKVKHLQNTVASASQKAVENLVEEAVKKGFDKETITNLAKANLDETEKMVKAFKAPAQGAPAAPAQGEKPAENTAAAQAPETGRLSDLVDALKNMGGGAANTNKDWTLREWETKDPDGLKNMMDKNPKEYARLFKNQTGMSITENDVKDLLKDLK